MFERPPRSQRSTPRPKPHFRGGWRLLETAIAWGAVAVGWCAGLLGVIGPRLGGADPGLPGRIGYVVEVVAAMWVPGGVVAGLSAAWCLLRRRWGAALALAPVALAILVPAALARMRPPAGGVAGRADRPVLRLATVNLDADNDHDPSMQASLRELDADVLVLVEFTRSWARRLGGWFVDDYPHRWLAAAPEEPGLATDGLRIAVWSRLPAAGPTEELYLRQHNAQIRVPLRFAGRTLVLYGIHPWKPYPYVFFRGAWQERCRLLAWMREETRPMVVAGDFNASAGSAFTLRLRRLGLIHAAEAVLGYAPATWPMRRDGRTPIPIAIDHVMYGAALRALDFRLGDPARSDHAPVVVELVWADG